MSDLITKKCDGDDCDNDVITSDPRVKYCEDCYRKMDREFKDELNAEEREDNERADCREAWGCEDVEPDY